MSWGSPHSVHAAYTPSRRRTGRSTCGQVSGDCVHLLGHGEEDVLPTGSCRGPRTWPGALGVQARTCVWAPVSKCGQGLAPAGEGISRIATKMLYQGPPVLLSWGPQGVFLPGQKDGCA